MIIPDPVTVIVPLHTDENGSILITGTRITLDIILMRYLQGNTPEEIHAGFEAIPLNVVYALISYYLSHRIELDAYLQRRQEEFLQLRQTLEDKYPPKITETILRQRLETQQSE